MNYTYICTYIYSIAYIYLHICIRQSIIWWNVWSNHFALTNVLARFFYRNICSKGLKNLVAFLQFFFTHKPLLFCGTSRQTKMRGSGALCTIWLLCSIFGNLTLLLIKAASEVKAWLDLERRSLVNISLRLKLILNSSSRLGAECP